MSFIELVGDCENCGKEYDLDGYCTGCNSQNREEVVRFFDDDTEMDEKLQNKIKKHIEKHCEKIIDENGIEHIIYTTNFGNAKFGDRHITLYKWIFLLKNNLNDFKENTMILLKICEIPKCASCYVLRISKIYYDFKNRNFMLINILEYIDLKTKLSYLCVKHNILCSMIYAQLLRNESNCRKCIEEKQKETCLEKYGEEFYCRTRRI